jgi:hypothetical protein
MNSPTNPQELPEAFHRQASHVQPDYRDGWNACHAAFTAALDWENPPPPIEGRLSTWLTSGSGELHSITKNLVVRFARAMAKKLLAAEKKYGYSIGWSSPDWMDECRARLLEHVAKGDPVDVANYCAFLWFHGTSTTLTGATWLPLEDAPTDGSIIRLLVEFEDHSLEDSRKPVQTIGLCTYDGTGEKRWQFAGWCWTHDHFTEGVGIPVGWLPFTGTPIDS